MVVPLVLSTGLHHTIHRRNINHSYKRDFRRANHSKGSSRTDVALLVRKLNPNYCFILTKETVLPL
ncbi:hypothetical protein D918_01665 [Trichuris suis]|nr:hypothetical protein D918_01665 [Trichuris suis]